MAKQTINIGSGELTGDGESLRSAFDKINDNFDEVYTGSGTTLGSDTSPALGGNLDLSGNDITGIGNLNITGNITATGSISASLDYSNLTNTPTTLAGYGIADAYTQTQVDTAITNATSNLVIQSGSTQSIDIVAADSTVLVDSVNGTLNATTLTGALPAIDGSSLTGITTAFSNITSTPTTIAGYGITDAQSALVSGTNIKTVNGESLLGSGNITITGGSGGGSAFTNIGVGADDSTIRNISEGESFLILGGTGITTASNAEGNITITGFDGAFGSLSGKPTTLAGYGITDALTAGGALTGTGLEAEAVGAGVADGNDLAISGGDATELNSTGGDANITGGSGALASGNVNIGASQTALVTIGSGSNNVDFPNGTAVDFTGATVTGLNSSALTKPIALADDEKITFGTDDDLEIFHNGTANYIAGAGGTILTGNWLYLRKSGSAENYLVCKGDGAVEVYYDNVKTFATSAAGIQIEQGVEEKFATLTGSTGTVTHDCDNGHVFYHTGATGDITANFTNLGLTAEYGTNLTVIINQGATPYEVTAVQIGGVAQTINWQGGTPPTGNTNGIDSFSFTILNDGGSYVVLGQMVDFT